MSRGSWDEYFLLIAEDASTRATCPRRSVGCVLVRDKSILSTGYNGSVRRLSHCDAEGCDMVNDHCVRTVHAEANAIAQAAREGARTMGATAYVTHFPCWTCTKLLLNAGVLRIVSAAAYNNDERVRAACEALGVEILCLKDDSQGARR